MDSPLPTFTVVEPSGIFRSSQPVRLGVPLPRGWLFHPGQALLEAVNGGPIPCQTEPLARWADGSVRWLLVSFLARVPERGQIQFAVRRARPEDVLPEPPLPLEVTESRTHFRVDTGRAQFELPRGIFGPFSRVQVESQGVLGVHGCSVHLHTSGGESLVPRVFESTVERVGAMCAVLRFEGAFVRPGTVHGPVRFVARLEFFAALSRVRLEFDLHNPAAARHPGGLWDLGDPGSFSFKELSIHVPARGDLRGVTWATEALGPVHSMERARVSIYQDSSGGTNWRSPNHVDARGVPTVSFQGYRVRIQPESVSRADQKRGSPIGVDAGQVDETFGLRAQPWVQVASRAGWVAGAVQQFWQNFPKSLGAEAGGLRIGLFPAECQAGFELQGGEKKRHLVDLEFGVHTDAPQLEQALVPLRVSLNPNWMAWASAEPWFITEQADPERAYRAFVRRAVDGPRALEARREQPDEYGWRHFGEVWADHETVHSRAAFPMVAHFNNQYDLVFGTAWHYLATGDPRWWTLMDDLARHVIDIDIYHTDGDRAAYNHGLFWHTDHYLPAGTATHRTFSRANRPGRGKAYGGGPSDEHNYTSGLLLYHYLTGDPQARDAVRELADWVIAMDDGGQTLLSLVDAGPTGWASQTGSPDFHRAGRGAGNSINALLDAFRLFSEHRYLNKAEALIRRCVHPNEDIAALDLDEPEYRWTYLVFLQVLGKYLEVKLEQGERDYMFWYARASLLHFADWMVAHEVPYQDVLDKVLIPTESWPATDMRKAHVLDLAAAHAPASRRTVYRDKAGFFFRRSLEDLRKYPTATLARPLTILIANGAFHGYFETHDPSHADGDGPGGPFDPPEPFVPQAARVRATVARHARAAAREMIRTVNERLALIAERVKVSRRGRG